MLQCIRTRTTIDALSCVLRGTRTICSCTTHTAVHSSAEQYPLLHTCSSHLRYACSRAQLPALAAQSDQGRLTSLQVRILHNLCARYYVGALTKPVSVQSCLHTPPLLPYTPPRLNAGRQQMREQDLDKRGKTTGKKRRVRKAKIRLCTPLFFAIRSPNLIALDRVSTNRIELSRIDTRAPPPLACRRAIHPTNGRSHNRPTGSSTLRPKYGAARRSKTTKAETRRAKGAHEYMKRQSEEALLRGTARYLPPLYAS